MTPIVVAAAMGIKTKDKTTFGEFHVELQRSKYSEDLVGKDIAASSS
jgi:hypothetical protein